MKLIDFEKIVCVSLDHRRNDWAALDKQFAARGARIERFIVGKGQVFPKEIYNQIDPVALPPSWLDKNLNAFACYTAHRAIITQAKKDKLNNILMLEDDCLLLDNFDDILARASMQIEEHNIQWDTLTCGQNIKWAEAKQISQNIIQLLRGSYCWHAIAISQQHNNMFDHFLSLPAAGPFDWLWAQYTQPQYGCYGIWPSIAIQKKGMSFINQKIEDYSGWLQEKGENDIT